MSRLIASTTIKVLLIGIFLCIFPLTKVEAFQSGTGVVGDPYVITTCAHLQDIQDYHDANFILGNDIDCSDTVNWNSGSGFNPIGGGSDFWGILDGAYFTIHDLYINRPEENGVGLFRTVEGGIVGSLNFDGADITGADRVGVVSGDAERGEFYDIHITNSTVVAEGNDEVGGILGYGAETVMEACNFNGTVTGANRVGGLVGYEEVSMDMSDSYNLGTVNGYIRTGGLIGSVEGTLSMVDSYNKGEIFSSQVEIFGSYEGVGGLVGAAWRPTILRSYNEGDISTSGGELYVGGLIGGGGLVNIQQSYNIGNISASPIAPGNFTGVGGVLGSGINVTILDSYNWGDINQDIVEGYTVAPPMGGILGFAFVSSIKNSYNRGTLTLESDTANPAYLGGLVGELYFEDWLFDFIISDTGKTFVAKVGDYLFELINNFNVGNLFGRENSILGGLIGSVQYIYENIDEEFILSNNWWSNNVVKGIGRMRDIEEEEDKTVLDVFEGAFEKEELVEGFKTYSHKVYNTDPDWDFAEIWSNAYEGRGYPVLGFQSILAPSKPSASVASGTYSTPFTVVLSSSGSSIRYSVNGVIPTCSTGLIYSSPIQVSSSVTIKAVACDEFDLASVLGEYAYVISAVVVDDDSDTPVVNLVNRYFDVVPEVEDVDTEDEVVQEEENDENENSNTNVVDILEKGDVVEKKFDWWWIVVVIVVCILGYVVVRRRNARA